MSFISNKKGLTLIEILATLAIMSVFANIALSSMVNVIDDSRFDSTVRKLQQLRNALVGETLRLETGLRKQYGYLGDMGGLPTTSQGLSPLFSNPGSNTWSVFTSYGIGAGWRGPYLTNSSGVNFYNDAWGNPIIYTSTGSGATLTSYGKDGAAGGTGYAQDISIVIPTVVLQGRVLGYLAQGNSGISLEGEPSSSSADIFLYYPDGSGGITSQKTTITPASSGKFSFSSIPLGYGSLKIYTPSFVGYTKSIGPSIVEINKATAAALPVQVGEGVFTTTACDNTSEAVYSTGSYARVNGTPVVNFTLSFPANVTLSRFYHVQEKGIAISNFTIDGGGQYRYSNTGPLAITSAGSNANITAQTWYNVNPGIGITAGNHAFQVRYASGIDNSSIYYFQVGCKLIRIGP